MELCLLNIILIIGIIGGISMMYLTLKYFYENKSAQLPEYKMMQKMAGNT